MAFCPSALPRATTESPVLMVLDLPIGTVFSPDAPCSWISAMSPVTSYPTTLAWYLWPFAVCAVIAVESSMTWLLVSTRPSELITMPVAAADSLLYCSAVLIRTRPGETLFTMACSLLMLLVGPPVLGCVGIAPVGSGLGFSAPLLGAGAALLVALELGWYSATTEPAPSAPAASATST